MNNQQFTIHKFNDNLLNSLTENAIIFGLL